MESATGPINYKGITIYENRMKQAYVFEIHSKVVGKLNGNFKSLEECRAYIDRLLKFERTSLLTDKLL